MYDPVYVSIAQGLCKARGLDVQIISDLGGGPTAIQAVASGAAEGGLSSVPAIINAIAAGLPIQGVLDLQTTFADQQLQKWYVLKDSPIQTIKDVAGKNYAINLVKSSFNYTSLMIMAKNGVDENSVNWVSLSFDKQIPALINGSVDVIGLMYPYQQFLQDEYADQVRVVWTDYNDAFDKTGRHVSLIFINKIWAQDHPDLAKAFVTCMAEGENWIMANPDAAKPIEAEGTGVPEKDIPAYKYTENGQVIMADTQFWMDYLASRGDFTEAAQKWVTADLVATNDYNLLITK